MSKKYLAIDIGASSGRHIVGWVEDGKIRLEEVFRFENSQVRANGHDCWDVEKLVANVKEGIAAAGDVVSAGIDTWGVDFVLVDEKGERVGDAVAYRDARTTGMPELVEQTLPFAEHYAHTGIQKAIFNTVYQLAALQREAPDQLARASRLLFTPDYLHYRLTGKMVNEYTIASTSSLVSARTKQWDGEILDRLGLPRRIFAPLAMPGTEVGDYRGVKIVLPASHDTGSAYLAVPARDDRAIYLSSGTWSLIGMESPEAITTPAACAANFSNEGGAWGRFRFLKNIMGLWMVQSVRRQLNGVDYVAGKARVGEGPEVLKDWVPHEHGFQELAEAARGAADFPSVVNATDERFLSPASMIGEVRGACRESGQRVPETVGELMQCVYRSLAASYAREAKTLAELTGKTYTTLNIVGGGSQDVYLNALTAQATGLEVVAGPTEGTAIGNIIVQMIAGGEFKDLADARRAIVRGSK